MFDLSTKEVQDALQQSNQKVYISCVGEGGFPNVSVRKVNVINANELEYTDNEHSRTVQLMMNSPHVLINVLNPEDPFHGHKFKGKATFQPVDANADSEESYKPVKVTIRVTEGFPY